MTTDSITRKGWTIGGEPPIKTGNEFIDPSVLPYINDKKAWEQFSDPVIYQIDKRMREWIGEMVHVRSWCTKYMNRRYTCGMMWQILFGRPYDPKTDNKDARRMTKVMAYYSSRINKSHYVPETGKSKDKKSYVISTKALNRPPYSLKLRLEWLGEQGKIPDGHNMQMPKDDLFAGHARNPGTNRNMELRREAARERARQYQRNYRRRLKEKSENE